MRLAAVWLFLFSISTLWASDYVSLRLNKGGRVDGELLAKRDERYLVDLGFTVLEVPASFVNNVNEVEGLLPDKGPALEKPVPAVRPPRNAGEGQNLCAGQRRHQLGSRSAGAARQ